MQVAAREGFTAAKKRGVPTAADYVTDGLIAMWDGIENAGWGVHNANATAWTDLVRPTYGYKIGADAWTDDAMVTSATKGVGGTYGGGYYFGSATNDYATKTFEVVFTIPTVSTSGGTCISWSSSGSGPLALKYVWSTLRLTGGGNGTYGNDSNSYSFMSFVGKTFKGSFAAVPQNKLLYANGQSARTNVTFGGTNDARYQFQIGAMGQTNVHWHAVRVYDRSLSAAEIAANNAVDKARFNLP